MPIGSFLVKTLINVESRIVDKNAHQFQHYKT